jgi:hypothetical protein
MENPAGPDPHFEQFLSNQRNISWPGAFTHGALVWGSLWNGLANPTPVQRIGAALLGMCFVALGQGAIFFSHPGTLPDRVLAAAFALFWLFLGYRAFCTTFRRTTRTGPSRPDSSSGESAL